jgi:glycosyltransferase involved in cell wall biosynthesis
MSEIDRPRFSVVMPTRNRPDLFAAALASVTAQRFERHEIVIVDDGSSEEHVARYAALIEHVRAQWGGEIRYLTLARRQRGHGSGYTMNRGVEAAGGEYVAFLDDDDLWIDARHLERADAVLRQREAAGETVDLYMTNQEAYAEGELVARAVWIESVETHLRTCGRQPDELGSYRVSIKELLMAEGFCHMNCLIVRRDLLDRLGARDETIGWEGDRDLYLRLLDSAEVMVHHPAVTARHHVPDPSAGLSITTALRQTERRLWQLRVLDKAVLSLRSAPLRRYAWRHKGYVLKRIAEQFAGRGDWRTASRFALEAMAVLPTFKWALFTLHCFVRRCTRAPRSVVVGAVPAARASGDEGLR